MPIVVNSNASATSASYNLSRANDALRKSLGRLSSGNRINSPADDAGGLAVAYKLDSKLNRTEAVIQNSQNALSFLQVQDGALATVGKVLDRMGELRTMAQDITKNSGDIENYSKEFVELQSQLSQIRQEKFNGISLFAISGGTIENDGNSAANGGAYTDVDGNAVQYNNSGTPCSPLLPANLKTGDFPERCELAVRPVHRNHSGGGHNTTSVDLGGFDNGAATGARGLTRMASSTVSSTLASSSSRTPSNVLPI